MLLTANIFQPLIDVFEAVLKFFHNSVGVPWGWSIVLLTVCIRALLVPLTLKQFSSMQKLQRLQPELKALQARYKDDKQRQQQELMKFYRENQVNPLGSCLPLVAQLPVFISLFYMLRSSLRIDICPKLQHYLTVGGHQVLDKAHTVPCGPHGGASFLFVNDLTNKAAGATLVVLIVLYVGTQLFSSLLMSSPTMDQTQRRIMLFMPLFFVVFIISFPAGVIVYWITTNSWTILQQYIVRKRIGPMGPPVTADATAGGGRGGGSGGATAKPAANGSGGGLAGLLRSRLKPSDDQPLVGAGSRGSGAGAPPPPPPRKKKKRSGRRR
ncbi:MAG: YidC/Oxa1 family rane protein insertase [Solirubrobacteraceae bacterium]|jgi:YidC/Oxa1 family membrane protein insertase|nr:YidC/Oxa1 family rane protein insertase [Solirubrobacteraceae bacterium]